MERKSVAATARVVSLLMLVASTCAVAEDFRPGYFSGIINDYSPSNVKGGPWEMHGQWSLELHREWGGGETADFYADMTMSGFVTTNVPQLDGTVLALQTQGGVNPHTHHIRLTHISVVWNMTGCPTFLPPATLAGFQISGTVSLITGNGSKAPFEMTPLPTSVLQVCVTGGSLVPYSNLTMLFTGPATSHFGPQAIHGVVRKTLGVEERIPR
jgi:hypothetical protein